MVIPGDANLGQRGSLMKIDDYEPLCRQIHMRTIVPLRIDAGELTRCKAAEGAGETVGRLSAYSAASP